ncbi:MAG: prenyltransferase, partial [Anaerolineaceae bacterium]|nr:prenyltransferase [Anaerolineaceae bacterium]
MQPSERSPVTQLFLSASPLALVGGILFYALGAGIADFLGTSIDWTRYWLGQAGVTLLQLSSYYLKAYYDQAERTDKLNNPSGSKSGPGGEQPALLRREAFLLAAITSLTVFTALTVLLVSDGAGTPALLVILGVAFLLAFFYTVPPVRLAYAGYGELSQAIFLTNLAPALAYLLQTGGLHRMLAMITFPMTALCLAMHLALL